MADAVVLVVGLGAGDEGKGRIVNTLTRQLEAKTIVRYNGGPQAAHTVRYAGHVHTFRQFGSGTLAPSAPMTYLSQFMLVNPTAMMVEADQLADRGIKQPLQKIVVHENALIVTPWHRALNQVRELLRGDQRHGSCGHGVGEVMRHALIDEEMRLQAWELNEKRGKSLQARLALIRARLMHEAYILVSDTANTGDPQGALKEALAIFDWPLKDIAHDYQKWASEVLITGDDWLGPRLRQSDPVIFEGAQGVLLDEGYGFQPYTTWSRTTLQYAFSLLSANHYNKNVTRLGVLRAYATRHGPGPLPTEDGILTAWLPEPYNKHNTWQRGFRVGNFDAVLARYALACCGGVDDLAITHLDSALRLRRQGLTYKICTHYRPACHLNEPSLRPLVTNIKVGKHNEYAYQLRLTNLLEACEPLYQSCRNVDDGGFMDIVEQITRHLQVPVTITSQGTLDADLIYRGHSGIALTSDMIGKDIYRQKDAVLS